MSPITLYKRQREILDFISQYIQINGTSPTLQEIADAMLLITNPDEIANLFTSNEIKLIMDKELDMKALLLRTLTLEEVTSVFNSLKEELLNGELITIIQDRVNEILSQMFLSYVITDEMVLMWIEEAKAEIN